MYDWHGGYNIPVTLSDGDSSIRSTIKSPDAEKLTKISAAEFQKQEAEGLAPTTELMIGMDYNEIISFVKNYDKEIGGQLHRRYVILKAYTMAEMKADTAEDQGAPETTVHALATGDGLVDTAKRIISAEPPAKDIAKNQLLTPATTHFVDKVADSVKAHGSSTTKLSNVKRTLTFGKNKEAAVAINTEDSDTVQQIPNKKNKTDN